MGLEEGTELIPLCGPLAFHHRPPPPGWRMDALDGCRPDGPTPLGEKTNKYDGDPPRPVEVEHASRLLA